jgi:hypothetical protein
MKELWTALVNLQTPPSESGDTECFTNVIAWADDPEDYRATITFLFEQSSCYVLDIEDCKCICDCMDVSVELAEQIIRTRSHPEDCIFGTLHYYPSKPC